MKTLKIIILLVIITAFMIGTTINISMIMNNKKNIYTVETLEGREFDCILILGAGVNGENPSPMLEDRLETAIELYKKEVSPKIVVSGDHGKVDYDEVNVMKNYLIKSGIPSKNIFMDHAGFSTYESIYRIRDIFAAKKILIVSQKYHLFRALHIAEEFKLEAVGVSANKRTYMGQTKREIREIIARVKDALKCMFKPKPKYLGEEIPVTGNGDITNDK